ncbi:hypothetical protein [Yersinia enterocolitica]|uniref:hypothetical protein n=1 Tax=Yersinia enterocolitica TaxID=630 RepID=UPI0009F34714|nr:hypothetical protein [Yersinia enterocolitica]EKN3979078.1 hypothetical protein [Yersinia enterocolitica]ELI8405259.1 hypothetical protein [Yersinia enterocolitica]PNM19051.1 hypothetical protein A6J65_009335 [Yersinia enterocolitica]
MSNERPSLVTLGSTVAAADKIAAWLNPVIQGNNPDQVPVVERHIGQFNTPAEVKRYLSDRDGCVRIAALRIRDIRHEAGGTVGLVTFAAYVMATDTWGYGRDLRCEIIVAKIVRRITEMASTKGMGAEKRADAISADNIYSGSLDDLGLTMWAVMWNQEYKLDTNFDISELPDFLRLGMHATPKSGVPVIEAVIPVRGQESNENENA